jgi:three-Cys-motif partner protein
VAERPRGFWTESKLDMLSAYLPAFTTASKRAPSTVYLDLFAGQATNVSRDTGRPIEGSLLRAVQTTPPFTVVRDAGQAGAKSPGILPGRVPRP